MADDELQPPEDDAPPVDPQTYAIRRVQEVVAETRLIHTELPTEVQPEMPQRANIDWQLHVWSPKRKQSQRALGMADMGGAREARPRDGAAAKK